MMIKCPHLHRGFDFVALEDYNDCYYENVFTHEYKCLIKKGKPPCDNGLIDKEEFAKYAYPKQANWLNPK